MRHVEEGEHGSRKQRVWSDWCGLSRRVSPTVQSKSYWAYHNHSEFLNSVSQYLCSLAHSTAAGPRACAAQSSSCSDPPAVFYSPRQELREPVRLNPLSPPSIRVAQMSVRTSVLDLFHSVLLYRSLFSPIPPAVYYAASTGIPGASPRHDIPLPQGLSDCLI